MLKKHHSLRFWKRFTTDKVSVMKPSKKPKSKWWMKKVLALKTSISFNSACNNFLLREKTMKRNTLSKKELYGKTSSARFLKEPSTKRRAKRWIRVRKRERVKRPLLLTKTTSCLFCANLIYLLRVNWKRKQQSLCRTKHSEVWKNAYSLELRSFREDLRKSVRS